jgi:hypothetical protein
VQLYELHGNTNLERCPKCGAEYMRDFRTRNSTKGVHHHGTGRTCTKEGCGTELYVLVVRAGCGWSIPSVQRSPKPPSCSVSMHVHARGPYATWGGVVSALFEEVWTRPCDPPSTPTSLVCAGRTAL